MNIEDIKVSASRAADLMRSLSHEKRLMLLCNLVEGERSVGELGAALEILPANASQQLALLRKDGLVETRREGQTVYYSLAGEKARRIIEVLYDLFCQDD